MSEIKQYFNDLTSILETAKKVDMKAVRIEDGKISGINNSKTIILISDFEDTINIGNFGINNIDSFLSKYKLIADQEFKFKAEYGEEGDQTYVRAIKFNTPKMKIEILLPRISAVKAVSSVKDSITMEFDISNEVLDLISSFSACNRIVFKNQDDEMIVTMDTIEGSGTLSIEGGITGENITEFEYGYFTKSIQQLFNSRSTDQPIGIGSEKGIMRININNTYFYTRPIR